MKTTIQTLSIATIITTSGIAGEPPHPETTHKPVPECYLSWFLGASIGTLIEKDEALINAHLGIERLCPESQYTHAFFLEVGHTEFRERLNVPTLAGAPLPEMDAQIIPLTLNYKFEKPLTKKLTGYLGAGAGVAFIDMDVKNTITTNGSFSDTVAYAHIFTGITYHFTPSFEAYLGARYIFMDDPDLSGAAYLDNAASINGDTLIEIGARYTF